MPASWNSIAWCPLSFGPTCCRSTCSKDSMSLETKLVFQVKSQQAKNIIQVQQSNKKKMSIELCLHNFIGYQVYSRTQSEQYRLRTTLGRGSRSSWGLCTFSRNKGPTSNNFRSWTQVLLASLATNSQLFVDTLVTTFQIPNARHACDAPRIAVHTRHMLVASTVSGLDAAGAHSQWHPRH